MRFIGKFAKTHSPGFVQRKDHKELERSRVSQGH